MASDDGLTRADLVQLVADLRHDLELLNQIMNTQATTFGWCDEYEERMAKYNPEFRAFTFRGRAPEGTQITSRNAFAARRLVMGHLITTCERLGMQLPDMGFGGVVRDHRALDVAREQLTQHL